MKIKELFNLLENANALTEAFGQGTKAFFVEITEGYEMLGPYRHMNPVFSTWEDFKSYTKNMTENLYNAIFEADIEFVTKFNIIGLTTAEARAFVYSIQYTLTFSLCSVK